MAAATQEIDALEIALRAAGPVMARALATAAVAGSWLVVQSPAP